MAIIYEVRQKIKKDGNLSQRTEIHFIYYTEINACDLCGKLGPPRKVRLRDDVAGWNVEKTDREYKGIDILCTGCWNKVKPIVKNMKYLKEAKKLVNKTIKEVRQCKKIQKLNDQATQI